MHVRWVSLPPPRSLEAVSSIIHLLSRGITSSSLSRSRRSFVPSLQPANNCTHRSKPAHITQTLIPTGTDHAEAAIETSLATSSFLALSTLAQFDSCFARCSRSRPSTSRTCCSRRLGCDSVNRDSFGYTYHHA